MAGLQKKILIVDDNKSVRDAIRVRIQSEPGLTVCGEAGDGIEAVEKAKELKPNLVLLDLVMPKLNGAATASAIKRALPDGIVVLFTMYEHATDALAPAVGADVVLSKPDGLTHLLERIQDLFESRSKQRLSGNQRTLPRASSLPAFDIFGGASESEITWIESVAGLGNAFDGMRQIAEEKPGYYFLFSRETHLVKGRVDTAKKPRSKLDLPGSVA